MVNLATNLADFFGSNLRVFAPSDLEVDFSKSRYMAGSGGKRILGKACFCDEFWINEKPNPFLAAGTPVLLAKIGLLETAIRLNPDFVFGLTMRSGPLRVSAFVWQMCMLNRLHSGSTLKIKKRYLMAYSPT